MLLFFGDVATRQTAAEKLLGFMCRVGDLRGLHSSQFRGLTLDWQASSGIMAH